ncbi:hypothetical protein [Saccharopolyspora spinosa]|uniref:hypothetical protein n=1 Tax=Saccharopolyspora spinosa TaxID=60894 RepID=UPI0002E6C814
MDDDAEAVISSELALLTPDVRTRLPSGRDQFRALAGWLHAVVRSRSHVRGQAVVTMKL